MQLQPNDAVVDADQLAISTVGLEIWADGLEAADDSSFYVVGVERVERP